MFLVLAGMVAFLKYIRLLFNLKSIKIKGPCISDRCGVFFSVFSIAFPGCLLATCWVDEFPNLIYAFTMNKLGVESAIKLQQEEVIFQSDSKIRNMLMKYTNCFDPDVDCKTLELEQNYNVTYLVNTEDSLGIPITDNRYVQYELALIKRYKAKLNSQRKHVLTILCWWHLCAKYTAVRMNSTEWSITERAKIIV